MSVSTLLGGAKVILFVNGAPFATVTGFRWNSTTPPREIRGLDWAQPIELGPGSTKVNGNLTLLMQAGDGGLEGAGMIPSLPNLPRGRYVSLTLIERQTVTRLFHADKCWISSQSWDVPTRGFVTGSVAFEAVDWNNEQTA